MKAFFKLTASGGQCRLIYSFSLAGSHTGKVQKIDIHGDKWSDSYNRNDKGILSLYIEGMDKSCDKDDGLNRVVVTSDHPLFDSVLSIALAAKIADKKVAVYYLESCNTRDKAWDFGYISLRD